MTNKEILNSAIKKATKNGYKVPDCPQTNDGFTIDWDETLEDSSIYFAIIFSDDFAKAFWGEEIIERRYEEGSYEEENTDFGGIFLCPYEEGAVIRYKGIFWKYHLQKMVLEENPLLYLKKFL
jgi:hypothetical protein